MWNVVKSSLEQKTTDLPNLVEKVAKSKNIFKKENDNESKSDEEDGDEVAEEKKQWIKYIVKIYEATDLTHQVKNKFSCTDAELELNCYVKVAFSGLTAKTSVKKATRKPVWDQKLIFTETFPPTSGIFIIELRHSGTVSDLLIAKHTIDVTDISAPGDEGYLPTFGPSLIYLYGSEKGNSSDNPKESISYQGKLLLAISTELINVQKKIKAGVKVESMDSSKDFFKENSRAEDFEGIEEEFTLFGCVFEASMINKKFGEKPLSLEISIGNSHLSTDKQLIQTHTKAVQPISFAKDYMYVPYEESKPCFGGLCSFPDQRRRSFISNSIQWISSRLYDKLSIIENMIITENELVLERLEETIIEHLHHIENLLSSLHINHTHTTKKTELDIKRLELVHTEITKIKNQLSKLMLDIRTRQIKQSIMQIYKILEQIDNLIEDPQHSLPDIFIWMVSNEQKVAFKRIPSRHIIFTTNETKRGKDHGKQLTLFLERNPEKSKALSDIIQAKVMLYLWLGLTAEREHIFDSLISGYVNTPEIKQVQNLKHSLPNVIHYSEIHEYELKVYIYQARSLIASDRSGLSDPYARIIVNGQMKKTQIVAEALNPIWNEMLVFEKVQIYGDVERTKESPPIIVVEVFDYDKWGRDELIGIAFVYPTVKLKNENNTSFPILKWYNLCRSSEESAGEILMAVELDQMSPADLQNQLFTDNVVTKQTDILRIPSEIQPIISTYRLEIVFWGLRNLKKLYLKNIKKPRVDIECAGTVLQSTIIQYKIHQNFLQPMQQIDIELPEQDIYRPPITIRVVDCRGFGITPVVGVHIIKSLTKYDIEKDEKEEHHEQEIVEDFRPSFSPRISRHTIIDFERRKSSTVTEKHFTIHESSEKDDGDEIEYRDWWTRYFLSLDVEFSYHNQRMRHTRNIRESKQLDLRYTNSIAPSLAALRKESLAARSRLSSIGPHGDQLSIVPNKFSIAQIYEKKQISHESYIKIYNCELEKVPEFRGFEEWLHTFDLYRGKQKRKMAFEDESRKVGAFKGSLKIYKLPPPVNLHSKYLPPQTTRIKSYFDGLPKNNQVPVLIKVYILQATNLIPQDINNKVDAYIFIRLGSQKINDKGNYIPKQINPVFGKCFTFDAVFPRDSFLTVQIYDWDLMGSDDLIGETSIDLENRFYSRHCPLCGLPEKYETTGFNAWRDTAKPRSILAELCHKWKLDGPHFEHDTIQIGAEVFSFPGPHNEIDQEVYNEQMALEVLHKWKEIAGFSLVPEHIETRTLYHPSKPEEQGKLEMWVDMFTMPLSITPPERDIAPRKPVSYELRVIIWNTDDVILADDSALTGEKSSDIYVKGWVTGSEDEQKTDVHYGSQTGEGNFNWRFIFPFDYLPADKLILVSKKTLFAWDETEIKIPAELKLQIWDSDHFSSDDCLGSLTLRLTRIPRGAKSSDHCSLAILAKNEKNSYQSIFQQPRMKGWWPLYDEDCKGEKQLTGKVEMELQLLTEKAAKENPAGRGRKEPDPLDKPQRPASSISSLFDPLRAFRTVVWRRYRWFILKSLIIAAFVLLVLIFIYNSPGYLAKKLIGA